MYIIAEILSLAQYIIALNSPDFPRLERCSCCGRAHPHLHGKYPRKADRSSKPDESLNPIFIQRYYCPDCRRTSSALPECIPPRRWYLWEMQQTALAALLAGRSLYAIAKEIPPSRRTIGRWKNCFKKQWRLHKDTLCHHIIDLGLTVGFNAFWQTCLSNISLAKAMRLCHVAGVPIP
jgi:transposase-like protein